MAVVGIGVGLAIFLGPKLAGLGALPTLAGGGGGGGGGGASNSDADQWDTEASLRHQLAGLLARKDDEMTRPQA